jgi:hypothetical protein
MAAPTGTWNFFTSGATSPSGTLTLSASNPTLKTGASSPEPITVVWDETSQILSFSRATAPGGIDDTGFTIEVYTGTLFQAYATANGLVSGEGVPLLLAGNFGKGTAGGAVGPFNQSGWFATSTTKLKEKEGKESKDSKDSKDKDAKDGKEHKDVAKEKEAKEIEKGGHVEKAHIESSPFVLADATSAMQLDGGTLPEVPIATGKSFIPSEERPPVGGSALQN